MKLKDIKTWATAPPSGIGGSFWVIVKITTDNGIEIAIWDILGKAHEEPVYQLIGGRFHERIRSYTYLYPKNPTSDGRPGKDAPDQMDAIGIHSQWIYIDPVAETVIVKLSSQSAPLDEQLGSAHLRVFESICQSLHSN